jgi:hypothetical protein
VNSIPDVALFDLKTTLVLFCGFCEIWIFDPPSAKPFTKATDDVGAVKYEISLIPTKKLPINIITTSIRKANLAIKLLESKNAELAELSPALVEDENPLRVSDTDDFADSSVSPKDFAASPGLLTTDAA